jgi:hypothetical protein
LQVFILFVAIVAFRSAIFCLDSRVTVTFARNEFKVSCIALLAQPSSFPGRKFITHGLIDDSSELGLNLGDTIYSAKREMRGDPGAPGCHMRYPKTQIRRSNKVATALGIGACIVEHLFAGAGGSLLSRGGGGLALSVAGSMEWRRREGLRLRLFVR